MPLIIFQNRLNISMTVVELFESFMAIELREDIAYVLLKKIDETDGEGGMHEVNFNEADFAGREVTPVDLLGHLDYLNQQHYINAEFTGNAYGSPDSPGSDLNRFKRAEITEKGRKLLEKMEQNPPPSLNKGPAMPIASKDMPFLEKVMLKGNLPDPFDARDITEVVFRTMRDMMTTEAAARVASELHEEMLPTENKTLQNEVVDLWQDTNPIVSFLSRIRPPLIIKSDTFLYRIRQEAGVPPTTDPETVIKAVFYATKEELSPERIQEVASFLPDKIREMWEQA
jgi:uncharacterized protein (DUF2267 family)